ncbi:MYG1 family protein [Beijerinckia sp. L45]|uniref:MYG1 family protein n=1 Tax=Beijerinckia sp. L45 TaxID=1641855 RepID=UPI00131B6B69|nr:MYG1 family protein [Beijerinckia sp. L45]
MPDHSLLVTHSGKFHCDEVFAYVVLRLALGLGEADHTLVRTRDAKIIASGDVVWDVGSLYDEATNRYDHHQRGAPVRDDGTPFSAAGLVWRRHGVAAVGALLDADIQAFAPKIAAEIDQSLVRRIDELDNGVVAEKDTLGLASLIGDFNPSWDAPGGDAQADAAFLQAVAMADGVLRRRVESLRSRLAAEAIVVAAQAASADPRILELDRGMPWKNAVFAHDLPVAYAIYPVSNGNWMVDSMPPEAGSFEQRIPLPQAWAGLPEADLAAASGVDDAVFVHLRRFVGAAKTRAGALTMARKAIVISEEA